MANKYTCFVISPIGAPDSETRKAADETFEYIVIRALEKFDFKVERADQILGITDTITKEMVERIQRSDLCIVDLTGLNPNVMYECGRRHETGKPCILISRDQMLPFDVVTHPVIRYSFDCDGKELLNTIRLITQNVEHFVESGFERAGARTFDDLYRELGTLNQRVDLLVKYVTSGENRSGIVGSADISDLIRELGGVIPAINYAISERNPELIDQLLPRAPRKDSENFVMNGLVAGSYIGSRVAFEQLEEYILRSIETLDIGMKSIVISGYSAGASRLDEEERAIPIVSKVVDGIRSTLSDQSIDEPDAVALIFNALQRIYHGLGRFTEASRIGLEILKLKPDDKSYLYNMSLNQIKLDDWDGACEYVDRYVSIDRSEDFAGPDDDHVYTAMQVYLRVGRLADARELFLIFQRHYAFRAQLIRKDDDFKALFN